MSEIRAFVGHSFTEADASAVSAFLGFFNQIQDVIPTFSWTHARAAEPKELAEKVLSQIADKNTFIGICTRRERVIAPDKLERTFWSGSKLAGLPNDFDWKTSDWIIQEIGLAVGRGMSLILLLENGCRKPGGLQGDVEFIPFDRSAPERAFGPLLEMIRSLSPSVRTTEASSTEGPAGHPTDAPDPPVQDDEPNQNWDRGQYESRLIWKIISDDSDGAAAISAAYLATLKPDDEAAIAQWRAITEAWRIRVGRGGSLQTLRDLHAQFPDTVEIAELLGMALSKFAHNVEAAQAYEVAATCSSDNEGEVMRLRGLAAVQYAYDGNLELARNMLDAYREYAQVHPEQELELLIRLRDFASVTKRNDLEIAVLERIVDLKPDDYDSRFALAFNHSESGNQRLALHHYLQIPPRDRSTTGWNNLGVSFQHFYIPAKAVSAYKTAADGGETLAMSNLGYKLMNAGFITAAREQFEKGLAAKDFHRNVSEGYAALQDITANEDKKLGELLDGAKPIIDFFKRVGKATARPWRGLGSLVWEGPVCELSVSITGDVFRASGQYMVKRNALTASLFAVGEQMIPYNIEYEGRISGSCIEGKVDRISGENSPSRGLLSLDVDNKKPFIMIVDEEALTISVVEDPLSTPNFYELRARI